ncbi:MAG: signal peptide peptidase SppA [Leptolyngbyaceae bacterium]|nr:signal peptide peptidase SppA [Leptolyngbyaceae bacterium]
MRDFFKYVFASLVGLAIFTTLGIGAVVVFFASLVSLTAQAPESAVEDDSILVVDLSVEITDSQPISTAGEVIGEALSGSTAPETIALRTVLDAIENAAEDDRIVGIYLTKNVQSSGLGSGFATLREVRNALLEFKATDKPIMAYETAWNERDYYLTSVADTVMINPNGLLEINGFKSEALFFGEALDRLGVGVSAIRAGQYKSAVEPFLSNERSPEEREQTRELLSDLWDAFLSETSSDQELTPAALQQLADEQGLILPDDAVSKQLVDEVLYFDEVLAKLRDLTGESKTETATDTDFDGIDDSFRHITLSDYADDLKSDVGFNIERTNQVALVYAEGNIVDGEGGIGQIGGDRFARILRKLRTDDDVKAIVLRVNSPGGSAIASDIIAREVDLASEEKPVIISMGSLAASGGYLISTYGDQIFASPNTITGSIGVFGLFPNVQELANKNGITWDVVKTGEYADIGSISRPPTEAEVAIAQRFVDKVYDDFLNSVSSSRPLSRAEVEDVAQGRVWSGQQALEIGLVDEMGGLEEAIAAAAEQAELENWDVVEYPQVRSFEEQILEQFLSNYQSQYQEQMDATPNNPLIDYFYRVRFEFETLRSLNDPQGVYSRMPVTYWID